MKRLTILSTSVLIGFTAVAQDQPAAESPSSGHYYDYITLGIILILFLLILAAAAVCLKAVRAIEEATFHPKPYVPEEPLRFMEYDEWRAIQKAKPSAWNKLLGLKPLEEETAMEVTDDYDGIVELNNPTPAWFMALFYGTIIFAVIYLGYYHVFNWGPLQDEEYRTEMAVAKAERTAFLAAADNLVDESTVKQSDDPGMIGEGQAVFATNCAPCHGNHAQGVVGPNLTDEFWLHGGRINNIFKTVKYGIPDKGMISWESKLTPKQIASVANYILSLSGTHPAGAKAPQGVKE